MARSPAHAVGNRRLDPPSAAALEHLARWLDRNTGAFCDNCIAKELALRRRQASRVALALASQGNFYRDSSTCVRCGLQRKVIQAL